jgi:hypothetical protein
MPCTARSHFPAGAFETVEGLSHLVLGAGVWVVEGVCGNLYELVVSPSDRAFQASTCSLRGCESGGDELFWHRPLLKLASQNIIH